MLRVDRFQRIIRLCSERVLTSDDTYPVATMSTYVLIAGAGRGGWVWKSVRHILAGHGHDVYSPSLTGSGDRVHLASESVTLATQVADITNLLFYEDLRDVILVGHSYGGVIVAAAADQAADRIGRIVFLDAPLIEHGERAVDTLSRTRGIPVEELQRNWIEPVGRVPRGIEPDLAAWMEPRLTGHLTGPGSEPVSMTNPVAASIPRTYVFCTQSRPSMPSVWYRDRFIAEGKSYISLDAVHDCMLTNPAETAKILLDLAEV